MSYGTELVNELVNSSAYINVKTSKLEAVKLVAYFSGL